MNSLIPLLLLVGFAVCALNPSTATAEESCELVVVYPGGPKPGSSGQRVIDDFVARLTETASTPLKGNYFNDTEAALEFLKSHPDSFVLGSTGFFLTHRKGLNLIPMTQVALSENQPEQYFLVAKKGAFAQLSELEGKKISGTPFFESAMFLDRVVFGNQIETTAFFVAEATGRPLSALRKLSSGDIDGVLLNTPQFQSLSAVPLDIELDTVFTSESIPSVGLMRLESEATAASAPAVERAVLNLSKTPEGQELCKGFGVAGFEAIDAEGVEKLVKTYENES